MPHYSVDGFHHSVAYDEHPSISGHINLSPSSTVTTSRGMDIFEMFDFSPVFRHLTDLCLSSIIPMKQCKCIADEEKLEPIDVKYFL